MNKPSDSKLFCYSYLHIIVIIIIFLRVHSPTVDDAFYVEHRHNFKHVSVPCLFGSDCVSTKVFDDAIHHPRCVGLTGMHAGSQIHDMPILKI